MAHAITNGNILSAILYLVVGEQSVIYNGVTYTTNQTFRGVAGIRNFAFSGSGSQEIIELSEFKGTVIEYVETASDLPVFLEQSLISELSVEYILNNEDKTIKELTLIKGAIIEFIDYSSYSFQVIET